MDVLINFFREAKIVATIEENIRYWKIKIGEADRKKRRILRPNLEPFGFLECVFIWKTPQGQISKY